MTAKALVAKLAKTEDEDAIVGILEKIEKLGEKGSDAAPAVIPMLTKRFSPREAATAALEAMIPEIVARDFVDALKDPKRRDVSVEALEELVQELEGAVFEDARIPPFIEVMRETAVPLLIELFAGPHRKQLANALGMIGAKDDAAFDALVEALDDKEPWVRGYATSGLVYFGERALPELQKLLEREKSQDTKGCLASSLGRISTKKSFAMMVELTGPRYRLPMDLLWLIRDEREKQAKKATPARAKELLALAKLASKAKSESRAKRDAVNKKPKAAKTKVAKKTTTKTTKTKNTKTKTK